MEQLSDVQAGLDELRDTVRMGLGYVLQIVEEVGNIAVPSMANHDGRGPQA